LGSQVHVTRGSSKDPDPACSAFMTSAPFVHDPGARTADDQPSRAREHSPQRSVAQECNISGNQYSHNVLAYTGSASCSLIPKLKAFVTGRLRQAETFPRARMRQAITNANRQERRYRTTGHVGGANALHGDEAQHFFAAEDIWLRMTPERREPQPGPRPSRARYLEHYRGRVGDAETPMKRTTARTGPG